MVADTLEGERNDKLRALAQAREERERTRQQDQLLLDDALRQRLLTMTMDFKKLWSDPTTPNRERKRLLACIIVRQGFSHMFGDYNVHGLPVGNSLVLKCVLGRGPLTAEAVF